MWGLFISDAAWLPAGSSASLPPMRADHFNARYYKRFYEDTRTSIISPQMRTNEVAFVTAFCRHIGVTIERFADAGAGTGWWAEELVRQCAGPVEIETYDASRAACELYGHAHVPVQKLSGKRADLVVCRDVLRYLNDGDAEEAIRRLAKKCRGVLYLHLVTRDDEFDESSSDVAGYFRPVTWYRARLSEQKLRDCGMGLFVSHRLESFSPWAIEAR